jgi:hypothetical protein
MDIKQTEKERFEFEQQKQKSIQKKGLRSAESTCGAPMRFKTLYFFEVGVV